MCAHYVLGSNIETVRVSSYFEQPRMLSLVPECHTQKNEVGKINCSKNQILGIVRAQRVFGERQIFETIFGHIQNFWQKQILHIFFF